MGRPHKGPPPKGPAGPEDIQRRYVERWEREQARQAAMIGYITDERMRPVEYWWEQHCAHCWPLNRLKAKASLEKWTDQRDRYRRGIAQDIIRDRRHEIVKSRIEELRQIHKLRQAAYDAIEPRLDSYGRLIYPVKPKSFEGMITAFLRLDQHFNDKRDEVLASLGPEVTEDISERRGALFSTEDMRVVARVLLERKRDEQTRRISKARMLPEHEEDEEDDEDESQDE